MTELNIYERLSEVMKDVDYIQKTNGKNNLKYSFASHDDVTAKCRESFIKHGIYPEIEIIKDSLEKLSIHKEKPGYNGAPAQITDSDAYVSYIKLKIKFVNIANPSDVAYGEGVGQGIDDQDKACGKAISYAYKYALLKALAIETGDDPDQDSNFTINKTSSKIGEQKIKPSDKQKLANIADDDMRETMAQKNQEQYLKIKNDLEACGSVAEMGAIWEASKAAVANLKKYAPALAQNLVDCKDYLKISLDPEKQEIDDSSKLSEIGNPQ